MFNVFEINNENETLLGSFSERKSAMDYANQKSAEYEEDHVVFRDGSYTSEVITDETENGFIANDGTEWIVKED